MIQLLSPEHWTNYQLIDSGNFEKLEQFGQYVLARPEPQAVWELKKGMPERWFIDYRHPDYQLTFKLALSSFKHVGIFPEQAVNWDYIHAVMKRMNHPQPRVLNVFAYTGGASLAARQAGAAEVVHVDSVKQVVNWARENMESSRLDNIRWIVDDALKFVKREVRRGNTYQGLILDPPAYGRGPEGEKWVLEEQINELLKLCRQLLDPRQYFFILNVYSLGFSALIVDNLVQSIFGPVPNAEFGELFLADSFNKKLPLGVFYRFSSH
jgi:23S rRNA (cytosine1962-C5)-methyltransferase